MYLNPDKMTSDQQRRVNDWLVRNGATGYVEFAPVVVRGNVAEFWQFRDFDIQHREKNDTVEVHRKRLRVRTKLAMSSRV